MTVDILSFDKASGYAQIRVWVTVRGEQRFYEQTVILPTDNDAKLRDILKKYGEDYEAELNGELPKTEIIEDVTANPSLSTRLSDVGQAIKRIF